MFSELWDFLKSLKGWQKIVAFIAAVCLALCALLSESCTRAITLHVGEGSDVNFADSTVLLRPSKY